MTGGRARRTGGIRAGAALRVDERWVVPLAAAAAFVLRLPGLTRPIRADEAGFLLVARAWDAAPGSVFGQYFVDRPPLLVWVYGASDAIGGPLFIRVVGAVGCALLVLAAAATARELVGDRSARWAAVCVAAITTNPMIDVVSVKGELLGLPFVMAGCWLALLALRRTSVPLALASGLSAGLAVHLKQSLVSGLVFAAVLLALSVATGRLAVGPAARLALAGVAGAAVPTAATVAWALDHGVRLGTLWYAVVGFRSDAAAVLAEGTLEAPATRAVVLLSVAFAGGLLLVLAGFARHLREEWAADRAVTGAALAVLVVDVAALVAGGSFWRAYLFGLVPATTLCAALLVRHRTARGRRMRALVVGSAVSSVTALVGWVVYSVAGLEDFPEVRTGEAVRAAAAPGDTLVVFGGRPDIQLTSGLPSPYRHLWTLPMRTLDPGYEELGTLLAGPHAPTWLVEWVDFDAWGAPGGEDLADLVTERYRRHGTGCEDRPVYLLEGVERPALRPDCS